MRKLKWVVVSLIGTLAISQNCMARDLAEMLEECGIGAMIAPKSPAVAAVTNILWDSGTTAISSNITSPDTCMGGKEKLIAFIFESYDSLEKDLASGSGKHLDSLMALLGYDSKSSVALTEVLRKDFARVVSDPAYTKKSRLAKSETLYTLVVKHLVDKA